MRQRQSAQKHHRCREFDPRLFVREGRAGQAEEQERKPDRGEPKHVEGEPERVTPEQAERVERVAGAAGHEAARPVKREAFSRQIFAPVAVEGVVRDRGQQASHETNIEQGENDPVELVSASSGYPVNDVIDRFDCDVERRDDVRPDVYQLVGAAGKVEEALESGLVPQVAGEYVRVGPLVPSDFAVLVQPS